MLWDRSENGNGTRTTEPAAGATTPRPLQAGYFFRARRGPIAAPGAGKTRITIRIDDAILEWFRKRVHAAGRGNYQSLINEALRQHIEREDDVLADTAHLTRSRSNVRRLRAARSEIEAAIARRKRNTASLPVEHYTGKRIREFDRTEADLGKALRRGKRTR